MLAIVSPFKSRPNCDSSEVGAERMVVENSQNEERPGLPADFIVVEAMTVAR